MTFGEKIKQARKTKGMTQKELAEAVGAKHNSISNWEKDQNKPDPDTIELLCGVLEIEPNYLLSSVKQLSQKSKIQKEFPDKVDFAIQTLLSEKNIKLNIDYNEYCFNLGEQHIILSKEEMKNFRDDVLEQIEIIVKRIARDVPKMRINTFNKRVISYYNKLASAGTGELLFDGIPIETIEIPDIEEYKNVDYAIGVKGDSMEPLYSDNDKLLVEKTESVEIGEKGIFIIDGECYVKELGKNELISLNKAYKNIPFSDNIKCLGKVVGKIEK